MNKVDGVYLDLVEDILANGVDKEDRTGTGTRSVFGRQMRFDLSQGFPLLTTKRVPFRLIASELLWFIKGDTNIRYLLQHNNHIWDEWAFKNWVESDAYKNAGKPDMTDFGRRSQTDPEFNERYQKELNEFCERVLNEDEFAEEFGDLGEGTYGKQWRAWETARGEFVDQLKELVETIKNNPDSRRMLVVAYNPGEVKNTALPPCHSLFQFYVGEGKLSCQLYQRSGDLFLGIPFNIASYSLLTHMIAQECGLEVGEFIHTIGDAHIYSNHMDAVNKQLSRKEEVRELPTIVLNRGKTSIFDFEMEDISLENYHPHPGIKAPVAV